MNENLFEDIRSRFERNCKDNLGDSISFAILGSPLKQAKTLIIGSNWGGSDTEIESQKVAPEKTDILEPNSQCSTYRGYVSFFEKLYKNANIAREEIASSVYLNACFIRTPNERIENKSVLEKGYNLSNPYLRELINYVKPQNIFCFGNAQSGDNATASVIKLTNIFEGTMWYEHKHIFKHSLGTRNNSYCCRANLNNLEINIFSFPHASRYNFWGKYLEKNEVFKEAAKALSFCQ